MKTKNLSLYLHIPFCVQKCKYCDFLSFSSREEDRNSYIEELQKEIILKSKYCKEYQVVSIFFGGGTPSILKTKQIVDLMECIYENFTVKKDAEISIESNPGTLTRDKLQAYRICGINRLSMGLQSANDDELRMLGRIHSFEECKENFYLAREVGFENINIDLMSALPGQNLQSYEETLRKVLLLNPEHISAYSLIVEEKTPLYEDENLLSLLPSEEVDRQLYHKTKQILKEAGYERYEISNYAKPGYECYHNSVYWTLGQYLGLGLGASSYFDGKRFCNESNRNEYRFDSKPCEVEEVTKKDQMEEFMFLGMRMMKGISKDKFYQRFGQSLESVYGEILKEQEEKGLIIQEEDRVFLTEMGIDVSNQVFCDYLL